MKYACTITHKSNVVKIVVAPVATKTPEAALAAAEALLKESGLYEVIKAGFKSGDWSSGFAEMWQDAHGEPK